MRTDANPGTAHRHRTLSHPGTSRRRTVLLPVVGLMVLAGSGLALLALSTARVGLVAELVGIAAALLPVGAVVAALLWVDRWEPEPARMLWLAFAWGASVAALTALLINNTAEAVGDALLGQGNGDVVAAVVSAPLVEEAVKGAFVLGVLLLARGEFHGVIDGVVYAGFVAAGFAFTENIYYFGRLFAEHGFGTATTTGVIAAFILRGVLAPFTHPLFTVMIGIGVGIAAGTRGGAARVAAPAAGYLAAVLLHALWNGAATLGGPDTFLNVYFLIMVPVFLAGVLFVSWHRRREQRIVADTLPHLVTRGLIRESEIARLTSLAARRRWRAQLGRRYGRDAARLAAAYQAAVTTLAFASHGGGSAPAKPGAADAMAPDLVEQVRRTRASLVAAVRTGPGGGDARR